MNKVETITRSEVEGPGGSSGPGASGRRQRSWRSWVEMMLAGVLVLVGVGALGYPVLSTVVNNLDQQRVTREYEGMISSSDPRTVAEHLEAAREYNTHLGGGVTRDPWLYEEDTTTPEYQDYAGQLNLGPVMSSVVIPTIGVELPVYHGTSENVLQKGLGHFFGTSLPVGGESTHAVITGHSGLKTSTMFDNLDRLREGDAIYVSTYGEMFKYQVSEMRVVLPTESEYLAVQEGQDLLTLITCTPYGINSHRLLVTAHRVPMDVHEVPETVVPLPTWLWVAGAAMVLVVLFFFWWLYRRLRGSGA